MRKIKLLVLFLNFIFIQAALSQTLNYELDRPFHHVENCSVCHDVSKLYSLSTTPAGENLRGIHKTIQTPNSGFKQVVFQDRSHTDGDVADFADGDALFNGICEVCHTLNNHHRNDGSDNTAHFDGQRCTACHLHDNEFAPPVEQAHRTHLDYRGKGPLIQDCAICHTPPTETNPNYQFSNTATQSPIFRDGNTLATTTACDNCHSPWGVYPGGDETTALMEPTLGAKANFRTGIYESDGYTLKAGKEKWCVTCHDDRPSTSKYDSDPNPSVAPVTQVLDHYDTNIFTKNADAWQDVNWVGTVPYWKSDWDVGDWATYNLTVTADGVYAISMKWYASTSLTTCTTAGKELLVEVTSDGSLGTAGASYDSVRWLQPSGSVDYLHIADLNISAGNTQIKVSKDLAGCAMGAGDIKVEPTGGSGASVVFAPMVAGDDKTWGFYATGHGVGGVQCTECHDPRKRHIDYNQRTHDMNASYVVNNPWGDSYRLQTKDPISGESLCARCHDYRMIWDKGNRANQTNFKSTQWYNYHGFYLSFYRTDKGGDSDFDGIIDTNPRCTNCHNVHGSTKPHMFRDGNLASTPYQTDLKPMFEHGYEVYAKATWKPVLQGGSYEVFALWQAAGTATNAPYTVKSSEVFTKTVKVDQTVNVNTWVSLGTYNFSDNNQSYVILNDKGTNGTVVADAIKFVSTGETVIVDNYVSGDYSTLGTVTNMGTYDTIAMGTTNSAVSFIDYNKPLVGEERNFYIKTMATQTLSGNNLCEHCHTADYNNDKNSFTGPKILNRFEEKRWVLNDGSEDAEVYVSVQDEDSNISSVTLDLTSIGGGVVNMNYVENQLYHYTIPSAMINGKSDISYKLPVTASDGVDTVVHETYLFPKDGADTIYMDTNNVELYNVNAFPMAVNTPDAGGYIIASTTNQYFGPGYRYSKVDHSTNYGIWRPDIDKPGKYEVYAFWNAQGNSVKYTAYAANGTFEEIKDQKSGLNAWNYIGTYNFLDDDSNYIKQESNDGLSMVADAMKFVRVNSEPQLRLSAKQHNRPVRIIDNVNSGVTVSAIARDYDDGDTPESFTYDWSNTDTEILNNLVAQDYNDISWYNSKITFNPDGFAPGIYTIEVTVTDAGGLSVTNRLQLKVPATYPTLGAADTDGDSMTDVAEGYYDLDEDGIPNYLDNNSLNNQIADSGASTITTEDGLEINIGTTAFKVDSDDGVVTTTELTNSGDPGVGSLFDGTTSVGGLFDFDILGLYSVGSSVKVTFLLQDGATIPAGAIYKKYDSASWQNFTVDADNAVYSTASVAGNCPAPGSDAYTVGLTAGHNCIQLKIQDGGPNDADGLANAEIKDPGGIFADYVNENVVIKKSSGILGGYIKATIATKSGGSGSFGYLSILLLAIFAAFVGLRTKFYSGKIN
ncbi:MAG: hypothetical protein QG617_1302 [Campylobacterota bacterium]|nr:hypothetical protein [Campylobacterota bacterium]